MLLALAAASPAQPARQQDLQALRARIAALSKDLEGKEAERREARDALRASERAISEANRALAAAGAEGERLRAESTRLAERRQALERSLAERQAAIERILLARRAGGAPDAVRVVLSGEDPTALARNLHYLGYVSQAAAGVLAGYRASLAELQDLARQADARRAEQRALEQAARAEREKIAAERRERRRVLDRVAEEVRQGRREIRVLRADESRLGRLVEEIGRVVYGRSDQVPGKVGEAPDKGGEEPKGSARRAAFSTLRGQLRLPVRGELTGRFGAPRGAAGTESKGVFIRAPEGQPVRAVAGGQVVYADWMRGFGNLMIVDHGEKYLSIYANNEALLKQVGDAVAPGETIATTGASGGNEESGLYFELRHLGRAFDPLRWVRLR